MKKMLALAVVFSLLSSPVYVSADDIEPSGPTITASDMVIYTNNPDPQAVTYSATPSDPLGLEITSFECLPASGSEFTVSYHEVTCTATNSAASTTVRTFSIELILDQTSPEITPPATQTFSTTTIPAAPILVPATATDDLDSEPTISYDPVSFSAGATTVTWTATDDAGNSSATTSEVVIIDESVPSEEDEGFEISGSIDLENGCAVTDMTNAVHFFPTSTTTEYLAICALQEALDEGIVDEIEFQDFGFGLFVSSVNGVSETNTYWKLVLNDVSASVGASELTLEAEDTVSLVLTEYDPETFEETELDYSVTLSIDTLIDAYNNVILPNACEVIDSSETTHEFSEEYLAICAVVEALSEGYIDTFDAVNFEGFGLFIDNFNDIEKPEDTYWQFLVGDESSDTGVTSVTLDIGDEISFILSDFSNEPVESCECIHMRVIGLEDVTTDEPEEEEEESSSSGGGGGGGGGGVSHLTFNVPAALAFLSSKQNADGSFASSILTDWTALAFAASDPGEAKTKLRAHLTSNAPSLSGVQDYIRHAMALMALGIDPYSGTATDYIAPIVSSFDGTQIGSSSLSNDDIFALFPLSHVGYGASDAIIQKTVAFIISMQNADGSWTGGVDMTAAAIQALSPYTSLPGVSAALTKAATYLHSQQQNNGGFGNSPATSWSMQAIAALGQSETSWAPGGLYPRDYLAGLQQSDGGVEPTSTMSDTRVWNTAYAIPGATGKTWHSLLTDFSKPSSSVTGGGAVAGVSTTTATTTATSTATSTLSATTTAAFATSTTPATNEIIAAIVEEIGTEMLEGAFETRIAQIEEPVAGPVDEEGAPIVTPQTQEEALDQIAAAAGAGVDWNLLVLAFLTLILFGIAGYVAFVRKYWR